MTRSIRCWNTLAVVFLALPVLAAAQQADGHRGYVAVNGGLQVLPSEFTDSATLSGPSSLWRESVLPGSTGPILCTTLRAMAMGTTRDDGS